jgi:HK97 family phage portal protein
MGIWDRITGKEQIRILRKELEEQRAMTLENFGDIFGVQRSKSGVAVSDRTALSLCPWYSAVNLISDTEAMLPVDILQATEDGNTDYKSNLDTLLNVQANSYQSGYQFRRTMTAWAANNGNAYAQIERDAQGNVIAFWPIPPNRVIAFVEELDGAIFSPDMAGGKILTTVYWITLPNATLADKPMGKILGDDMLHLTSFTINGVTGVRPSQTFNDTIGLGLATEAFANKFFSNGAKPLINLKVPGKMELQDRQNARKEWYENHGGIDKSNSLSITQNGAELQTIGTTNEDSQFLETRKFTAEQVCQIFRIPPVLLACLDKAAGNNSYESLQRMFLLYTMMPWLCMWRTEITRKCFSSDEINAGVYLDHDTTELLQGDTLQRYQAYQIGRNAGFLSVNMIMDKEGENRIKGGDTFLQPLNMTPLGQGAANDKPKDSKDETDTIRNNMLPFVLDICGRITRREQGAKDKGKLDYAELAQYMRTVLAPMATALKVETAKLDAYINGYCERKQTVTPEIMATELLEIR